MSSPVLLIPLTSEEGKDFLPSAVQTKLDSLPLRQVPVSVPLADPASWKSVLEKHQPEALLCAWGCPPLPDRMREPTNATHRSHRISPTDSPSATRRLARRSATCRCRLKTLHGRTSAMGNRSIVRCGKPERSVQARHRCCCPCLIPCGRTVYPRAGNSLP